MFRHWLHGGVPSRPPGALARAWRRVPWRDLIPFIHITAGAALIVWGLEAALPFTVWRVAAGAYVLCWAGWRYVGALFLIGVYAEPNPDGDA